MPILTVTPNTAIDRTLVVPNLAIDGVFRETEKWVAAGGKGINVARAIHHLGAEAICAGFVGGWNGQYLSRLLSEEKIAGKWTPFAGETRTCTIIVDPTTGSNTVVNERGATVNAQDWTQLRQDVLEAADTCNLICFSGSLPPGSPLQSYLDLISKIMTQGKSVWVDTSAETLRAAAELSDIQIKVNRHELGELLGQSIETVNDLQKAADEVLRRNWKAAVVTMGSQGAAFIAPNEQWLVKLPSINAFCAVGSGDSFLAGLVVGETLALDPDERIRMGAAAGAANTLIIGGGRFLREDYERILSETVVAPL